MKLMYLMRAVAVVVIVILVAVYLTMMSTWKKKLLLMMAFILVIMTLYTCSMLVYSRLPVVQDIFMTNASCL